MKNKYIQPDLITFSTLAKGLCKWSKVKEAIALLDEMK